MSSTPAYGRRLVPQVLDELAISDPGRVYAAIPKTADVKDGYRDVTVADLARCANFMARWIEGKFGRSDAFETITYVGLSDLKGMAILLGAIKTGYKLFTPSPRLPAATITHLMRETSSVKVLHAAELSPLIKPLVELNKSAVFDAVPSFETMLESTAEHYPYDISFDNARNHPIIVLHSSGSTGLPKPITITHGSVAAQDNDHHLSAPAGRKKLDSTLFNLEGENRRFYLLLPFFHLGGFIFFIDHAILNNLTLVLGPAHIAPDAALLKEISQQQKLRAMIVVPAVMEQLLHVPYGTALLKSLDFAVCVGAPLSSAVGDQIQKIVTLYNLMGTTETFPLPELHKSLEDWIYHEYNPHYKHEMRPYDSETGTFELVINADDSTRDSAPVYHNVPGEDPFFTKDLYTAHPTKPNLYKYYGRRDDILVLANGEKLNPIPLEQHVQALPGLKGVMLAGSGRSQTALLVEPTETLDAEGQATFLELLWPRVQEANSHVPSHGRVARGMIICASPEKPFTRTAKNTIIRKFTEEMYKDSIENLFTDSSQQNSQITVTLRSETKTIYQPAAIVDFVRQILAASFPAAAKFGEDEDFFSYGIDSIQVLEIVANMKRNLAGLSPSSVGWLSPRTIFLHPTLNGLSNLLSAFLNDGAVPIEDSDQARAAAVEDAVARYTKDLPSGVTLTSAATSAGGSGLHVAVIGSTGYVGSHLIATLLGNTSVAGIHCLNRADDAAARQRTMLDKYGISEDQINKKLTFRTIQLGIPHLGLDEKQYSELVDKIDVIVYNAWRLDFGLSIHSFHPFLQTTRDLVDLVAESRRTVRIVFISSISSVQGLANTGSDVLEEPVEDPLAAANIGYGQSKLVAERILIIAHRKVGVPVSILRVGQIGGSNEQSGGVTWPDQPWISALLRTSASLGSFPSPVAPINWVPVDTLITILEKVIADSGRAHQGSLQVFNVVSPSQPWEVLFRAWKNAHGTSAAIPELVSLPQWMGKLRSVSNPSDPEVIARFPALRLLDFYHMLGEGSDGGIEFQTTHAREFAGDELYPVSEDQLASWLKSWKL